MNHLSLQYNSDVVLILVNPFYGSLKNTSFIGYRLYTFIIMQEYVSLKVPEAPIKYKNKYEWKYCRQEANDCSFYSHTFCSLFYQWNARRKKQENKIQKLHVIESKMRKKGRKRSFFRGFEQTFFSLFLPEKKISKARKYWKCKREQRCSRVECWKIL